MVWRSALILCVLMLCGPACRGEAPPLQVVASFSILADLAAQVGADEVSVAALVPPGRDLHQFQPKPADAKLLAHADLVVVNGLGGEGWLDQLVRASGYKGPVVAAGKVGTVRKGADGATDPHSWQDVGNARAAVVAIADALAALRPERAERFRARARAYDQRLVELQGWIMAQIAAIPEDRRVMVVPHEAFGYFAAAYGVTVLALQGVSSDAEPTAQRLAGLSRTIRAGRIAALFSEANADSRPIRQLAAESGVAVAGELYSDSLSPPDGPAPSYERMMRHNVTLMTKAMAQR
jgi:zinc/manganese transport system substrate-binding protein